MINIILFPQLQRARMQTWWNCKPWGVCLKPMNTSCPSWRMCSPPCSVTAMRLAQTHNDIHKTAQQHPVCRSNKCISPPLLNLKCSFHFRLNLNISPSVWIFVCASEATKLNRSNAGIRADLEFTGSLAPSSSDRPATNRSRPRHQFRTCDWPTSRRWRHAKLPSRISPLRGRLIECSWVDYCSAIVHSRPLPCLSSVCLENNLRLIVFFCSRLCCCSKINCAAIITINKIKRSHSMDNVSLMLFVHTNVSYVAVFDWFEFSAHSLFPCRPPVLSAASARGRVPRQEFEDEQVGFTSATFLFVCNRRKSFSIMFTTILNYVTCDFW